MPKKGSPGPCTICRSEHRAQVDVLLARGQPARAIARQFGLPYHSLWRHGKNHITDAFRASVKLAPAADPEELTKLCLEEGISVAQQARAVFGGLFGRWLVAIEAGNDHAVATLSRELTSNMRLRAAMARELAPGGPNIQINNLVSGGDFAALGRDLMALGADHPEIRGALKAILRRHFGLGPEPEPQLVTVELISDAR